MPINNNHWPEVLGRSSVSFGWLNITTSFITAYKCTERNVLVQNFTLSIRILTTMKEIKEFDFNPAQHKFSTVRNDKFLQEVSILCHQIQTYSPWPMSDVMNLCCRCCCFVRWLVITHLNRSSLDDMAFVDCCIVLPIKLFLCISTDEITLFVISIISLVWHWCIVVLLFTIRTDLNTKFVYLVLSLALASAL